MTQGSISSLTPPTHFFSQYLHGCITNGTRARNKCKCHMLCWGVETKEESQELSRTFKRSLKCVQPPQANSCSAILRRQSSPMLQEERFVINKQCWSSQRLKRKTMSLLHPYFPSTAAVVPLPAVAGTGRVLEAVQEHSSWQAAATSHSRQELPPENTARISPRMKPVEKHSCSTVLLSAC